MKKPPFFINAHAHCFTVEHVPDHFAKTLTWLSPLLTIGRIRKYKFIRWLIYALNIQVVRGILGRLTPAFAKSLPRLMNFAENFDISTQKIMINELQSYYPAKTRFVLLSMDMEYMSAGRPEKDFIAQLDDLAACKKEKALKDVIYPFVFADPRRKNVTEVVISRLEDKEAPFQGIKLYPALGYYPFDERLKDIYKYALEHNTPIITHCVKGSVYYRGRKSDEPIYETHPVTGHPLPFKKPVDFTANFTHPYNYECLLNPDIIRKYWNDPNIDLSKLKICLAHFGGEDEWIKYLQDTWLPDRDITAGPESTLNVMKNIWYDSKTTLTSRADKAFSWFSIICEMIRKYPNVYADISYTLREIRILPLLKILLQADSRIADKVLYGSDYFVVSMAGAEREMSLYVRGYLGEELFTKIAYENTCRFLNLDCE